MLLSVISVYNNALKHMCPIANRVLQVCVKRGFIGLWCQYLKRWMVVRNNNNFIVLINFIKIPGCSVRGFFFISLASFSFKLLRSLIMDIIIGCVYGEGLH